MFVTIGSFAASCFFSRIKMPTLQGNIAQVKPYIIECKIFILNTSKIQEMMFLDEQSNITYPPLTFLREVYTKHLCFFYSLHFSLSLDSRPLSCLKVIVSPFLLFLFAVNRFEFMIDNIIHNLMQKIKGKQQWTQEQRNLLSDLFPKFSSKKWKMISMEMALKGFKRTELECRQKWINFLDPSLNNEDWSSQELEKLYNFHDKYGTRWCFMQKELNRTQNRIKNRFYGTIRNYIRLVMNTLCQRQTCFNTEINKISPSLLNDLYNSENIFDFLRGEIKKMIYRMKFTIDKKTLRNRIKEKQHLYRELLGLIGSLFKGSFSLKFFDIIDHSECNDDNDDDGKEYLLRKQQNIKPQQKMAQQIKIINQQQNQNDQKGSLKSQSNHIQPPKEVKSQLQNNLRKCDNQNMEQVKQTQHLNADYNTHNPQQQLTFQSNNKSLNQAFHNQNAHSYPFLEQSSLYAAHQQWLVNHAYREHVHQKLGYELMIQKIRQQNLILMKQQQDFLVSQFANNNDGRDITMNPYRQ